MDQLHPWKDAQKNGMVPSARELHAAQGMLADTVVKHNIIVYTLPRNKWTLTLGWSFGIWLSCMGFIISPAGRPVGQALCLSFKRSGMKPSMNVSPWAVTLVLEWRSNMRRERL